MVTSSGMTESLVAQLVAFRRALHARPELSLQEVETTNRIRAFLTDHGVEILEYALNTGVIARVQGNRPGPCIAIRADIDALPIVEQTGLPYASQSNGVMHACGHDFHTAAVLGATLLLKQQAESEASFNGTVMIIFQPAEELGCGATQIIDTGVFQDHAVQAILGEHNNPRVPSGQIGVAAGPLMASVDDFRIVVQGVGGHAAIPDRTIDPVLIGAEIATGLQHVVSRAVSPLDSVVVTVGTFHAGTARNVIPNEAVLEGTVRCLQPKWRHLVEQRLRSFAIDTAAAYGGRCNVQYERVLPGVVNDPELAKLVAKAAATVVGEASVVQAEPTMAGEDFALYQELLPGLFFWVGVGDTGGQSPGWHHPAFDVDESMIPVAAQVFTEAALEWLHQYG